MSDLSKSGFTSEKSLYEAYSSYSPMPRPVHRSVSYEQDSITPVTDESHLNQLYLNKMTQIQESLYAEIEVLKNEKKALSTENIQLRAKIQDIEKQVDSQIDKLQKKDKELNKLVFDKDMYHKAEEDYKRIIEEMRKKTEHISKENVEAKQIIEVLKHEKREILKSLRDIESKSESMLKNLKIKEDLISNLQQSICDLEKEKSSLGNSANLNSNLNSGKISTRRLEISDLRGVSESPDRKKIFGLSERADETMYKNLYLEANKLLSAENHNDFKDKIVKVKDIYAKYMKLRKFIDKLADMIVQCSPSGSFNKEPSTHQIWKWLTRLLEEYMKIKQSISGGSYEKLCQILNTENIEIMVERVAQLQNSRSRGVLRNN
jgi:chromosome segregation ATPase